MTVTPRSEPFTVQVPEPVLQQDQTDLQFLLQRAVLLGYAPAVVGSLWDTDDRCARPRPDRD